MNQPYRNLLFDILDALSEIEVLLGDGNPEVKEKLRQINQRIIHNARDEEDQPPSPYDLFH
tara:strand:- start:178 stop:360 length:183 start_codon:yes stop_codon:yes gene_type:complete